MIKRLFPFKWSSPWCISIAIGVVFSFIKSGTLSKASLTDGFTVSGLLFLVLALSTIVARLGFFDIAQYGFYKFFKAIRNKNYSGKDALDFSRYREEHMKKKDPLPFWGATVFDLAITAILLCV